MKQNLSETLRSRNEIARIFGVCGHTIRAWEKRGLITPIRINARVLRYSEADIQQLLEGGRG